MIRGLLTQGLLNGAGGAFFIVGSAIVKIVEEHAGDPERMAREIGGFVSEMRESPGR